MHLQTNLIPIKVCYFIKFFRPSANGDHLLKSVCCPKRSPKLIPGRRPFQISQRCEKTKCKFKSSLNASPYSAFIKQKISALISPFSNTLTFWKMPENSKSTSQKPRVFVYHFSSLLSSSAPIRTDRAEKYAFRRHLTRIMGESVMKSFGDLKAMQISFVALAHM